MNIIKKIVIEPLRFLLRNWVIIVASLLLLAVNAFAFNYYYSIHVPQEKVISYSAAAYINGVEWVNDTTLVWGANLTKQLDVINLGTVPAYAYLITSGLPIGWNQTWTANATLLQPSIWANGTLTLEAGSEPGTYTWDSWIVMSP